MTSILTERPYQISPEDAGCWIEAWWEDYAPQRLITLAVSHGFAAGNEVLSAKTALNTADIQADETLEYAHDIISTEAERAHKWLNEHVAPPGYHFEWVNDEYFLLKD